jgi:hypothetical protein
MTKKSCITALVSVSLWASFVFAQQKKSQWPQWREYVYAEDGFAITLPEDPHPHPDASLPDMTIYTVVVPPHGNLSLRVFHQDLDCAGTLAQIRDGALKSKGAADPASVKDVSIAGHPGVEYQYSGSLWAAWDRYYCVNGWYYIFSTGWPKTEARPSAATRIVSSFRLLKTETHR